MMDPGAYVMAMTKAGIDPFERLERAAKREASLRCMNCGGAQARCYCVAESRLTAAIESAKLQHGHRGALKCTCDAVEGEFHRDYCAALRGHEYNCAVFNVFSSRTCNCRLSQPTPSEIAAANMLKSGGMGVHYIASGGGGGGSTMLRHSDDGGPTWDAPQPRDRQHELWIKRMQCRQDEIWHSHDWDLGTDICRACDITAQLMIDARVMCKPINRKPGEQLARAFALGHADDYADRLSPIRRHGFD
jgi:hypothetical protein